MLRSNDVGDHHIGGFHGSLVGMLQNSVLPITS